MPKGTCVGEEARRTVLPCARGELSGGVIAALREPPGAPLELGVKTPADPLRDEDLQLALYLCYELHYGEIEGVDPRWEWDPRLLALRGAIERRFEDALRAAVPERDRSHSHITLELQDLVAADDGPSLSRYVESRATLEQVRELLVHRSAYQLKEADPHSWAIPRLSGAPKAALIEVQADEYGGGRAERIHAQLFANTMAGAGLDARYNAYLDRIPGHTLATVNLMSMLGLHRRLRGAIVGHLAAFEMTSSLPNKRYGNGLRRLGFDEEATDFFDEHVEADAVHENIAGFDLAAGLARLEPGLASDILWGAGALLALESASSRMLLDAWREGASSLLSPLSEGSLRDCYDMPDACSDAARSGQGPLNAAARSSLAP